MRTSTFSSLAILASSLLVKEAFAGPIGKRAVVTDNVIVTEEIIVTAYPDGLLRTGKPKAIGTKTLHGSLVVTTLKPVSTIDDLPTSTPAASPKPAPSSSSSAPAPAVFKEKTESTTSAAAAKAVVSPASTPSETPAPVPTTTSTQTPVVAPEPTTFAQVISSAAAPVASVISSAISSGGSSGGGKRGVAFNDASFLSAFTSGSSVSWCYNWGATSSDIPSQLEYVPMLWGLGQHANGWEDTADKAIASGAKHFLAFNEPDLGAQANLGVGDAVQGYKDHMQPYAGKVKLGSPAVTNGGSPMGLTWLSSFISSCSGCTIDFVAVHWYNGGDAAAFKDYIGNKVKAVAGGRPIWITEFQAPGSEAEQIAWLAEVLPWLDSQDYVERYSLFMASEGLMMSGGGLSSIGKAFVS